MKSRIKTLTLLVLLCSLQQVTAQNFITQWNLATAGSGATQLSFGTATSGTVNYTWQQVPSGATGSGSWTGATLTIAGLPAGATIRLEIAPTNFQRIIINTGADRNRLTRVEQWGTTAWTSMQRAFLNCVNLQVTATDVPDLSGVTTMSEMFRGCAILNSPSNIGSWNTSVVTDMSSLFNLASAFNQNISSWNTAAVTNMSGLFGDAAAFNQDIGAWNTAAVTNMVGMFAGALVFNRNIGAWNTAAVNNMNSMFFSAYAFNQNISGWNTAAVTNMSGMFGYAYAFNQNIGTWNTSAVTNMSSMFIDAFAFNQNIGTWNTSAVTTMRSMFIDAYAFNQNIGTWNTAAVTNMERMFDFTTAFNQDIGAWNTAAVTDMRGMFGNASAFNQNIATWSLNPGVLLTGMFNNSNMDCNNYSATLIGWSANPSTPNGKTLGATGRQYGTNAVAARTNLTSTKGWTITGDTPSGAVCGSVPTPPTVTNFTPASGPIGTTVTINGTNFSTTPANNIVFFGATKATVSASTLTQLTVSVPAGATYQPVSILVNGLTAFSQNPFIVTFTDGGVIDVCAFAVKMDVTTGSEPFHVAVGDLDSDGKPDLVFANSASNTVSIFKNISSTGSITTSSFETKVDFTTETDPYFVAIKDLDGDGKPDLVVSNNGSDNVSVFKNTTTTGTINSSSFAPRVNFNTGTGAWTVAIHDFDSDGKPDLAITNETANTFSVLRNTSTVGTLSTSSFAAKVDFITGNFPLGIAGADVDGDGLVDLAVSNSNDNSVSVFRNTSTVGSISFNPKIDYAVGIVPYSVAAGDLDEDGRPDLAVANFNTGSVSVLSNSSSVGSVSFLPKIDFDSGAGSLTAGISDMDGDGKADLVVANGGNRISVLKNINSSTPININSFAPRVDFASTSNSYGLALGDLDGNGKPDVAATNYNGTTASILRNTISSLPAFTASAFSPTSGPVGTAVIITGTNFSTTPLNNTVKFNGTVATVTASTSTSITAIVPVGATTGSISLEIGCITALTVAPFTVTTAASITITTQPSNATLCVGETATFTTSATGTTNITYQWQFSPTSTGTYNDIADGGAYSNGTTASLSVNTSGNFGAGFYRCKINGDLATPVFTNAGQLTINALPSTPATTNEARCGAGGIMLTASGAAAGQYRWYSVATGGAAISGEVNTTYTIPSLNTTTNYFASINNGTCESLRAQATATINTIPIPPSVTPESVCQGSLTTLSASGGTNGQYRWYTAASGGTSIPGQVSNTFTTPVLSSSTTYYVSINDGSCESLRTGIIVTVQPCVTNQPPAIAASTVEAPVEGKVTVGLLDLLSDPDNNLDLSSLKIIVQLTSGAKASIDAGHNLILDYKGISFSGKEKLTIEVCDLIGVCVQKEITINVVGDIVVYNGISPNDDGKNDIFYIGYIDTIEETKINHVFIYNRWGDLVFDISNYDNKTRVFKGLNNHGNEIPSGTYFYKIEFSSGKNPKTGYISLQR